jgi:hypothetical protein
MKLQTSNLKPQGNCKPQNSKAVWLSLRWLRPLRADGAECPAVADLELGYWSFPEAWSLKLDAFSPSHRIPS